MNVERQTILLRRNVSHQRPPIIEMNCQVRRVVTLCILPTFPCPGKGFEGYQHELDVESIFRLPYEKSFILPAENCGMWVRGHRRLPIAHHFEAALRGQGMTHPLPLLFSRPSVPPSAG